MPIRHCLGPEALIYHMGRKREEGSVIQSSFKNTSMTHREGQISLILPALSGFRLFVLFWGLFCLFWVFFCCCCPRSLQCSRKGVSWASWGMVWANKRDHAGWKLGISLPEGLLPAGPLQVTYPTWRTASQPLILPPFDLKLVRWGLGAGVMSLTITNLVISCHLKVLFCTCCFCFLCQKHGLLVTRGNLFLLFLSRGLLAFK